MKRLTRFTYPFLTVLVMAGAVPAAQARVAPCAATHPSRFVVFPYSRHQANTILTRPMSVTDIQLAPGEKLKSLAIGDSSQWLAVSVAGNILVKPTRAGLSTPATIVTNKRVYQVTLRSGARTGHWYQQVSWR
jgi:type IV secretion system protein VirB9